MGLIKEKEMEIPVIDFSELDGENRTKTMSLLDHACDKWGFFMVDNHGIDKELMDKVKQLINSHYEEHLKEKFYQSEMVKALSEGKTSDADWESTFFVWHKPTSNISKVSNISDELIKTMDEYVSQLHKFAERLSKLMCENLGLPREHIVNAFSGIEGPVFGTKVAKYPECPHPELIRGLREHTDAGGIILLLQDDQVPGLEFLKDGKWVPIPPSKNNTIFVNTGDQVEILSNGKYKSVVHRVMTMKQGSRLSIATFYNPAGDAIISPAQEMLYPSGYRFQDYLKLYSTTKFGDKGSRFNTMKKMENGDSV
ncbi:1-aminocyclopropane-1-carboxylate oxidase 1-like [Brassica rapa]|uniref:1-aminocyclopropane-1-carboxylate oxidase 1 n=1 Tax=Brassica campestris TaxID=3711 RepID=UPI0004F15541|nr:1-aminocyclopropane-1-carboxylate oxidase 1 [Brassica rapa]XP_033131693.1 1-aminocyclopropane-1-carboxylate oxidase 1-like [Brassica rapa]